MLAQCLLYNTWAFRSPKVFRNQSKHDVNKSKFGQFAWLDLSHKYQNLHVGLGLHLIVYIWVLIRNMLQ